MIMDVLDKIGQLRKFEFQNARERNEILTLCDMLSFYCSGDKDYTDVTADVVQLLNADQLTDQQAGSWLSFAENAFGFSIAKKINEGGQITGDVWKRLVEFYSDGNLGQEVAAFGLYVCAQRIAAIRPMFCYQLIMTAFSFYPNLAIDVLGINYYHEGVAVKENLTLSCPFCGSTEATAHFCSNQVLSLDGKQNFPPAKLWMKCPDCDNYYTYNFPLIEVEDINGHYTKNNGNSPILETRRSLSVYNSIFTRLKKLNHGRDYLEIGVGNGEMLAVAQEFGYLVDAVEICKEDCERISAALDVNIKWCDIVNYDTDKRYDVIVMGDVLEHVTKPILVLQKAKKMLKDDGVLWIATPNYNCAYARMEKFLHCMWHELNHYTYMSYESLNKILHDMQLEVVHYDISKRYNGSMELFIKRISAN